MSTLVSSLQAEGFRVTFVPMYFSELPQPETAELEAAGIEILERPRLEGDVADIRSILAERGNEFEKIVVSRPHNAVVVIPLVRGP
jgi:hypothetical protein